MDFAHRHILSAGQFSRDDLMKIIQVAETFLPYALKHKVSDHLSGFLLGSLFYEPSTRTRLSCESAMQRLGGKVISVAGMEGSSLMKGETLYDTAQIVSRFADIIAIRHPDTGSAKAFAAGASVPVINGGDGSGEHPTQALLDIFTLWQEKRELDGLKIALVGDLKFGRTVHSLVYLLRHFSVELFFVSPSELPMPDDSIRMLKEYRAVFSFSDSLEEVLPKVDVVYMTRVQKERFDNPAAYERLKHSYVLNRSMLDGVQHEILVLHPLPRVGEISQDVDSYSGVRYFTQVQNGVAVRMALLSLLLGKV